MAQQRCSSITAPVSVIQVFFRRFDFDGRVLLSLKIHRRAESNIQSMLESTGQSVVFFVFKMLFRFQLWIFFDLTFLCISVPLWTTSCWLKTTCISYAIAKVIPPPPEFNQRMFNTSRFHKIKAQCKYRVQIHLIIYSMSVKVNTSRENNYLEHR